MSYLAVGQLTIDTADAPRALVEELLNAGLLITDLLASLLEDAPEMETPEDGEAMIELVIGICRPALVAAPTDDCLVAATLVHAIRVQILEGIAAGARNGARRSTDSSRSQRSSIAQIPL
jgi:hypothetical protein